MAELKADVLVLGAGMVGVGAALHLQKRGRDVILVDRDGLAGEGTSFGNAGMIECASVFPYMFPRDFREILRYAQNRSPQVRYSLADLPAFLPWLLRYYLASSPERAKQSAMAELPLIRRSLIEHEALIAEAGAGELLRRTGWIKMYRSDTSFAKALSDFERAKQYGVTGEVLDDAAIKQREPQLAGEFKGAIHFSEPGFVPDPGGLAKAYAALFKRKGGRFLAGDARTLEQANGGWRVNVDQGAVTAREAVVRLDSFVCDVKTTLEKLWSQLGKLESNGAIITGATGAEPVTSEERSFLKQHPDFAVRATGTMFGHTVETQFPLGLGLAALAISRGSLFPANDSSGLEIEMSKPPAQIVVVGAGHWRGEGMALVEAIK